MRCLHLCGYKKKRNMRCCDLCGYKHACKFINLSWHACLFSSAAGKRTLRLATPKRRRLSDVRGLVWSLDGGQKFGPCTGKHHVVCKALLSAMSAFLYENY